VTGQLDAVAYVEHLRRIGALPPRLQWPTSLVIGLGVPNQRRIRRTVATPFGDLTVDGDVGVLRSALVGAPAAAVLTESLGVLGVERVVAVGRAGALGAGPSEPSCVEVAGAESCDGTSRGYGAHGVLATAPLGFPGADSARTATIDTPFLIDDRHLGELARRGAQLIDMELAAILAAAGRHAMAVSAVFVTSDRRQEGRWTPYDPSDVDNSLIRAVRVAGELIGGVT